MNLHENTDSKVHNKSGLDLNQYVINTFFKDSLFSPEKKQEIININEEHSKFINLVDTQNSEIVKISSTSYITIHENLENLGKKIIQIEEKINLYESKLSPSQKSPVSDNQGDYKTKPQIESEITELTEKIKENEKKIADYQGPINELNKKITDDSDYVNKFVQEKKSIVDDIKEKYVVNMTYKEDFEYDYQYEMMQIILQEINKSRIEEKVKDEVNKNYSDEQFSDAIRKEQETKLRKTLVFNEFKLTCYNAWMFKNKILALEGLNLINEKETKEFKIKLENLLQEAKKYPDDKNWGKFFSKLHKFLKILLFLTIGQMKIEGSKKKMEKIQSEIKTSNMNIAELKGKKALLDKILDRIKRENNKLSVVIEKQSNPNDKLLKEYHEFLKELKMMKNAIQISYNSFLKHLGDNLIKPSDLINS